MPAEIQSPSGPWVSRPVFISSTFTDMQAERNHLRDHVFPRLEEELRKRRHQFEPIDLRLGVDTVSLPDEQARELRVLTVCLDEIDRSRPFLLVLLGDRYGWVPAPERIQTAAWEKGYVGELAGKSVTALEIEFGLIKKDAEQRQRSFVYLREPLPYARMPKDLAAAYSDAHASDSDAPKRAAQLTALKKRLREDAELEARVHPYRVEWDEKAQRIVGLKDWGDQVFKHLWAELDEETRAFASAPPRTWQQQERIELQQFVDARRRDFVGREDELTDLLAIARSTAIAEGDTATPWGTCVTGAPGSGKSALLAELHARLASDASVRLLTNAAGATTRGADVDATLRRFIEELAEALALQNPLPEDAKPDVVEATFASLLSRTAERQRVVVLLDALNQFDPTPRAQQLTWLKTTHWPANARLIVTALPDAPGVAVLSRTGRVKRAALPPLSARDVDEVAKRVWARYHREINPEVVQSLKSKKLPDGQFAAGNPLWLTLALEQLNLLDADAARAQRDYAGDTPAQKVHALLLDTVARMPPDVPSLYGWLLESTERAYGPEHARAFAVLIALSRFGWRERDLLPLVPAIAAVLFPGQSIPKLDDLELASIRRGFRAHLVRRGESQQLNFFHAQIREAVQHRALGDPEKVKRSHTAIADHLQALPLGDPLRDTELMVHLIGADEPLRAAKLYAELPRPSSALAGATQALARHVTASEAEEATAALEWVASLPTQTGLEDNEIARACNRFLFDLSDLLTNHAALRVQEHVAQSARKVLDRLTASDPGNAGWQRDLSVSHIKIGDLLQAQGDWSGASQAIRASLAIRERLARTDPGNAGWQRDLAVSHERVGDLLQAQGDLAGASQAFRASLAIDERLARTDPGNAGWQRDLAVSQEKIGDLLRAQGDLAGASQAFRASLAIRERLARTDPGNTGWQRDLSVSHIKIGDLLQAQGDLTGASQAFRASLAIRERLARTDPGNAGWQRDLSVSHIKIGDLLQAQGDLTGASQAFRANLAISERLARTDPGNAGWQRDLAVSHERVGDLLQAQGDLAGASQAFRASLAIIERLARTDPGNAEWQRDLGVSHDKIGGLLQAQGDLAGASQAFRASLAISERLARTDPGNAGWQRDLVVSHFKLYGVTTSTSHLVECARILDTMQRAEMYLDAQMRGLLAQLTAAGIKP
jgi:tetratricopeptide (TPR) repeat protein